MDSPDPLCSILRMTDVVAARPLNMTLIELFPAEHIFLNVDLPNRKQLIRFLADRVDELGIADSQVCAHELGARESLGSTGLGNGVAIPHARIADLDNSVCILVTLARPIDFEAVDHEQVDVAIMLLMPDRSAGDQLKVLARIAKLARTEPTMNAVRRATAVDEALTVLHQADQQL